jgi:hypothetical protein
MNEIALYRGKRTDNEEWVEGGAWFPFDNGEWNGEAWIIQTTDMGDVLACDTIEVIPSTVGQFTGMKDKNKVKTFKGDLVYWPHLGKEVYVVYYNEEECQFLAKPINTEDKTESYLDSTHMERIGNIHDQ